MKYYIVKDRSCDIEMVEGGNCSKKLQKRLREIRKQFPCHKFSLIRKLKY